MAQGNYVAKNLHKTSRAAIHVDHRNNSKLGYEKNKKNYVANAA